MGEIRLANLPVQTIKTLTTANQCEGIQIPLGTKKFVLKMRDSTDFTFKLVAGDLDATKTTFSDPYTTIKSGNIFYSDMIEVAPLSVYCACASSGKVIECIYWI